MVETLSAQTSNSTFVFEEWLAPFVAEQSPSARFFGDAPRWIDELFGELEEIKPLEKIPALSRIDSVLAHIDQLLAEWLVEIVKHPLFVSLYARWLGLWHLIGAAQKDNQVIVEILPSQKEEWLDDFFDYPTITQSALYHHLYKTEYDQAGGMPYASVLMDYAFCNDKHDIKLLAQVAQVAQTCHAPAIANVDYQFFASGGATGLEGLDLKALFEQSDYIRWNSLRSREEACYLGLALPRMRLASSLDDHRPRFSRLPELKNAHLAWVSASYGFGMQLIHSFRKYGWCAQICGLESGGLLEDIDTVELGTLGYEYRDSPLEINFSDREEQAFATFGFIPYVFPRAHERVCLYSAPSLQVRDARMDHPGSSLPYLFLAARFAHYQKVIHREALGSSREPAELELELDKWLASYVSSMPNPDPQLRAQRPLRAASVRVIPDQMAPGYYQVKLTVEPHLQMEGINTNLTLVSKLPTGKE